MEKPIKQFVALLSGVFCAVACSAATYTAGTTDYGENRPDDLTVADNLFAGRVPTVLKNDSAGKENTGGAAVLTDGKSCDTSHGKGYFYTIGNGAELQWMLGKPRDIREFRIYAAWGDNNRNDIVVSSISYLTLAGEWRTIEGSAFASSQTASVNTIGEVLVTGDRCVFFAADEGELLASGATAIKIVFGKQDNDYGGYCEIQALGSESEPDDVSDAFGGRPSLPGDVGLWAGYTGNNAWDSTSQVKPGEVRFQGVYPAYYTDSTRWYGVKADGSTSECYWGNNQTYYYEGYMYFHAATYVFVAAVDDGAEIKIDGETVLSSPNYEKSKLKPQATWTPPRGAGWYPVKFRVGNGTGGYGPIGGGIGFGWNITGYTTYDNSENWQKFIDPGDGSLLRTTLAEPLDITGGLVQSGATTSKIYLDLTVVDGLAGAAASIAFADDPKGYVAEGLAWTDLAPPLAAGSQAIEAAVPPGTTHVVVSAVKDEKRYWTTYVALDTLEQIDASLPAAVLDGTTVTESGVLNAQLTVKDLGGAESVTVTFKVTNASNGKVVETVFENVTLGTATYTLAGLVPDRTRNVSVTVANENGETLVKDTFDVNFDFAAVSGPKQAAMPGLLQGVSGKAWDADFDIVRSATGWTPSAFAGSCNTATAWPVYELGTTTVLENSHWGDNKTFGYAGMMYFEDKTYTFHTCIDDTAQIKVDGTTVVFAKDYNANKSGPTGTWTPTKGAGWYPIDIRVGNGTGEYGPIGNVHGLAWNTTGYTTNDKSDRWRTFTDPGDGSLLLTRAPHPDMTLVDGRLTSEGYSVTVRLANGFMDGEAMKLYACYGATFGGSDEAAWTHRVLVSDAIRSTTDSIAFVGFTEKNAGEQIAYLRFELVGDEAKSWSSSVSVLPSESPVFGTQQLIDATEGDQVSIATRLDQTGAGDMAAVTFEYGLEPDLSDGQVVELGSFAAGEAIEKAVAVTPGKKYYYRLVAMGSDGETDATDVKTFVTKAGAAFGGGLSASVAANVVTYTVALADVGARAAAELTILVGTSESELAEVESQTQTITEAGTVSFVVTYPFLNGTVYAKATVDNACTSESWHTETAVLKTDLVDNTTYTWKEGVTEGEWTDPANWIPSVQNEYTTYPNSGKARANFKNCTVPTTVYVNGSVQVDVIQDENNNALDLTFTTSPNATEIATINVWAMWWDGFGESDITIDNLRFITHDGKYMNVRKLLVTNGSTFQVSGEAQHHKGGAIIEVSKGSTWLQNDWCLSMNGEDTVFILDDSTYKCNNGNGQLYLARNSGGGGDTIIVRGKHPVFDCNGVVVCRDGDPSENMKHTKIIFEIPEGGYEEAPFKRGEFLSGSKLLTDVLIDPASPVFKSGKVSTQLVGTTINKPWIDYEGQVRPDRFTLRYEGGTADAPTELWFDYVRPGLMVYIK